MTRRPDAVTPASRDAITIYRYVRGLGYEAPDVLEIDVEITRTYAGRHQRSAGAWSWSLLAPNGYDAFFPTAVGSQWPAREIARHIRAGTIQGRLNSFDQLVLYPGETPPCTTST